jgi:hypothetical protein
LDFSSRKTLKYLHIIFGGAQAPPYIPVIKETKEMSVEYTNRYNDVYTFTKQENGDVLWEGNFEFSRYGFPNNPDGTTNHDIIDMVDPSGGPYIRAGQMLSHIVYGDDLNVIVESFERVDTGYIIKCKEHEYDPNDMSHLRERTDEA